MISPFQHVVIVGCGLLGTSLGMALRNRKLAASVTGVGRSGSPTLAVAYERGAFQHISEDPAAAVAGTLPGTSLPPADLVVLCTPVRQFPIMFRTIAPAFAPGAIVTDVGSTKSQVLQWAAECLPTRAHFIGSHPMAGSEKSGPEAAREDLYNNAVCLVCRSPALDPFHRVTHLWQSLGMRVIPCDPALHDHWVAAVSHLPHALSATLMNTASTDPAALEAAAGGFVDTTRIAGSDVSMWTDIFLTNRAAAGDMLAKFQQNLANFKDAVDRGDEPAIRAFLTSAKSARQAFMTQRRNSAGGA